MRVSDVAAIESNCGKMPLLQPNHESYNYHLIILQCFQVGQQFF